MSVTIETIPSEPRDSVYRPIIYEASSDRNDLIDSAFTVDDISDDGFGNARLRTTASHNYIVGDLIELTGAAEAGYNGFQTVEQVPSATEVDTTKAFIAAEGASPTKTATLKNSNFEIRIEVNAYNGDTVAITGFVDNTTFITGTTSTPHGLLVGFRIEVRDTTSYNGLHIVTGVPSATEFEIVVAFVATETGTVVKTKLVGTKRVRPITVGSDNLFRFNIMGILRAQLSSDIATLGGAGTTTPNDGSIEDYLIQFFEEHDDEEGLKQEFATIVSVNKQAVQATLQHLEVQDLTAFYLADSTKRFLTNMPKIVKIDFEEELQLAFLTDITASISGRAERFNNAGASIGIVNTGSVEIIRNRGIFACNKNILSTTMSKVELFIFDDDGAVEISERITFIRELNCFKSPVRLWWLNRLGAYDAYTFTANKKETIRAKKTTYQKELPISFVSQDKGVTTLGVQAGETVEVWSEFLNQEFREWLTELITSPEVFLEIPEDDLLVPVTPTTRQLRFNDDNKLPQLRVKFTMPEIIVQQG